MAMYVETKFLKKQYPQMTITFLQRASINTAETYHNELLLLLLLLLYFAL